MGWLQFLIKLNPNNNNNNKNLPCATQRSDCRVRFREELARNVSIYGSSCVVGASLANLCSWFLTVNVNALEIIYNTAD